MSYFNHAFSKAFPATLPTGTHAGVAVVDGFVNQAGVTTAELRAIADAPGVGAEAPGFGIFAKDGYTSVTGASAAVTTGQALIIAGSSIKVNDKQGKFHGGYAESNKSKYINPKYVIDAYKFTGIVPEQSVVHVGVTNFQVGTTITLLAAGLTYPTDGTFTNLATTVAPAGGTGMTVDIEVIGGVVVSIVENQVGTGYTALDVITVADDAVTGVPGTPATATVNTVGGQECEFEFLCGETYNLFINLSGNPVLRVLNHDSYRKLAAYTGCCPDGSITPEAVDSTLVMIDWASQIVDSPYLQEFVMPVVFDEAGNPWFSTAEEAVLNGSAATQIWSNYVSTGHTAGALAGIRLIGAYIDTQFDVCSFQCSDYFNKDIVKMEVMLTDEEGSPCDFNGLCVETECCGFVGQGFGDTYLKEILVCEGYLTNNMSTDIRIREITQGNNLRDVVNRYAMYDKYVIQHVVPRWNNASSQFDDDQYNIMIYVPSGADLTLFEGLIATWLTAAGNPLGATITANSGEFPTFGTHSVCTPTALPTVP